MGGKISKLTLRLWRRTRGHLEQKFRRATSQEENQFSGISYFKADFVGILNKEIVVVCESTVYCNTTYITLKCEISYVLSAFIGRFTGNQMIVKLQED